MFNACSYNEKSMINNNNENNKRDVMWYIPKVADCYEWPLRHYTGVFIVFNLNIILLVFILGILYSKTEFNLFISIFFVSLKFAYFGTFPIFENNQLFTMIFSLFDDIFIIYFTFISNELKQVANRNLWSKKQISVCYNSVMSTLPFRVLNFDIKPIVFIFDNS